MPNRILREGILTSERVDQLTWSAEVFYRRLMSIVDDYGRYDARVSVLRAALFPLRLDRLRETDVQRWMAECQKAGLIALYEAEGKRCLQLLDFRQEIRAKKSKWPDPPKSSNWPDPPVDARNCEQPRANENKIGEARSPPSTSPSSSSDLGKGDQRGKTLSIPSVDEVRAYCAERKNHVNAQEFLDYYAVNGWVQGRGHKPIKDWKAAVRTWENNARQGTNGSLKHKSAQDAIDYLRRNKEPPCFLGGEVHHKFSSVGFDGLTEPEQRVAIDKTKQALEHPR